MVLVAVSKDDKHEDINWIANKLVNLRIFNDENNQMNRSVDEVNGEIMIVSQFTLYASTKRVTDHHLLNLLVVILQKNHI